MIEGHKGFQRGVVVSRRDWTTSQFSIRVKAGTLQYQAGQFTKLAMYEASGELVRRAYSIVNHPSDHAQTGELEFLLVSDPNGQLSPKLNELNLGDEVLVGDTASGFMTLVETNPTATELWMLSTGTGVGPYFSFLDDESIWQRYEKIILVHAVRFGNDLCYSDKIESLQQQHSEVFNYVPVVSRESYPGALSGRIPMLLDSGELESQVGVELSAAKSFVYVCGNPQMVRETSESLIQKGLNKHLRRQAGQFTSENYW
ncbi:ferredoxin--NADP reductase [Vibrio astriarenae]|uniref:ferredoxin--NADP reductase n=1 Tax=Vibrio astriarenae TaxID=1481923 RepID=UPI003735E4CA